MESTAAAWLEELDETGETPMNRALKSGNYTLTKIMMEHERRSGDIGEAPRLHQAAFAGDDTLVDAALDCGDDIDAVDAYGDTALHKAVRQDHYITVLSLLQRGAMANLPDDLGLSAIHWATLKGSSEMIAVLIQFGADVNARDGFSAMTPYTYARLLGYKDLSRLLARFGGSW